MHKNIILDWNVNNFKVRNTYFFDLMVIALGVFLVSVAAQITIPTAPVPVTLQDMTILLLSMLLGSKRGLAMVISYLVLGFSGAPVFAGFASGPAILFTPVAGYLLGFIPLAYVSGFLVERGWGRNPVLTFFAGLFAMTLLFVSGAGYLMLLSSASMALKFGVLPFIGANLVKLVFVSFIIPAFGREHE